MNIKKVLDEIHRVFENAGIDHAVIGGQALASAGVFRMSMDLDLILLLNKKNEADNIMHSMGYKILYSNENVANYISDEEGKGRVDILFAHRKYARSMLERAIVGDLFGVSVKIITPEDLIGLKVQSSSNDLSRKSKDMADIEAILDGRKERLDLTLIREYFKLFNREAELDHILDGDK